MSLSLDAWRRAKAISQEEMADFLNISIVTYRKWEKNPGQIKIDKAILIADKLQIPLDDIVLSTDTTTSSTAEDKGG